MRILFINDYGYEVGGTERAGYTLDQALKKRGHETSWFTSDSNGGGTLSKASTNPFHKDYFCRGTNSNSKLFRALVQLKNKSAQNHLGKIIEAYQPDIVHIHNYLGQLSPTILEELTDIPTVATLHTYKEICPKGTLQKNATHCTSHFGRTCLDDCLSISEYAHETLKRRLYANHNPIRLYLSPSVHMKRVIRERTLLNTVFLPNGIFLEPHFEKHNGKGILLFVGRLTVQKGVGFLLQALQKALETAPGLTLKIAGSGPDETLFKALAKKLRIEKQIEFLGFCDENKIKALHQRADVLVTPSLWQENASVSLLEGLKFGTPLIATDVGGNAEFIEHGKNGLLVNHQKPQELTKAILRIIQNPPLRQAMERESFKRARNFDIDRIAEAHESVYQHLI